MPNMMRLSSTILLDGGGGARQGGNMEVTLQISDDIARRMSEAGIDLSRRALESLALEEFKSRHITQQELRRLPGFGTRWKLDGFLKAHGVMRNTHWKILSASAKP
jgi:hypothetical protein